MRVHVMSPESFTSCYMGVWETGDTEACVFFRGAAGTAVDDPLWTVTRGDPGRSNFSLIY